MSGIRTELPRRLYRTEQVRALDRLAIQERGIPGIELMERAGKAVFDILNAYWPQAKRIVIFCGGGNNGGDGYIVARLANEQTLQCDVVGVSEYLKLKGDAKTAADRYLSAGGTTEAFSENLIDKADVIVDALLGTGLDRDVEGEYNDVIGAINAAAKPVLAVDIPSGLNADSGGVMGKAVKADATVTFIGLKQGMFTADGPGHCGSILFSDLGVPQDIYPEIDATAQQLDFNSLGKLLPKRDRSSHKGDFGHALLIGGDYGFAGAIRMAAEAAARVGTGLVSVATRPEHALSLPLTRPEVMTGSVQATSDLNPLLEKASVIAIGPGLGQSEWAQALLSRVLETKTPLVLDADALNLLALEPTCSERWVLTPHPGEAARLLNKTSKDIQADRFTAAGELQQKYGGVTVLKGCGTIIADNGNLSVCTEGNPGMASGGMGDVLTGVIAGLIAQGLSTGDAARLGVCLHANAADEAAKDGERGMLATDLMPYLRGLVNF